MEHLYQGPFPQGSGIIMKERTERLKKTLFLNRAFWTCLGHCAHELKAALVTCTRLKAS